MYRNLTESRFSGDNKTTLVKATYKKDETDKNKNYRPVNLLNVFS